MKNFRSRRGRRTVGLPEVSLTPLIDTALTLLVIFMITTPMMNNVIKINLPSSSVNEGDSRDQQETIVYVDKQSMLYLNGTQMSQEDILMNLQKMSQQKQIDILFVKGDQDVEYGKIIKLVDAIKTVGKIKCVGLATERAVH